MFSWTNERRNSDQRYVRVTAIARIGREPEESPGGRLLRVLDRFRRCRCAAVALSEVAGEAKICRLHGKNSLAVKVSRVEVVVFRS